MMEKLEMLRSFEFPSGFPEFQRTMDESKSNRKLPSFSKTQSSPSNKEEINKTTPFSHFTQPMMFSDSNAVTMNPRNTKAHREKTNNFLENLRSSSRNLIQVALEEKQRDLLSNKPGPQTFIDFLFKQNILNHKEFADLPAYEFPKTERKRPQTVSKPQKDNGGIQKKQKEGVNVKETQNKMENEEASKTILKEGKAAKSQVESESEYNYDDDQFEKAITESNDPGESFQLQKQPSLQESIKTLIGEEGDVEEDIRESIISSKEKKLSQSQNSSEKPREEQSLPIEVIEESIKEERSFIFGGELEERSISMSQTKLNEIVDSPQRKKQNEVGKLEPKSQKLEEDCIFNSTGDMKEFAKSQLAENKRIKEAKNKKFEDKMPENQPTKSKESPLKNEVETRMSVLQKKYEERLGNLERKSERMGFLGTKNGKSVKEMATFAEEKLEEAFEKQERLWKKEGKSLEGEDGSLAKNWEKTERESESNEGTQVTLREFQMITRGFCESLLQEIDAKLKWYQVSRAAQGKSGREKEGQNEEKTKKFYEKSKKEAECFKETVRFLKKLPENVKEALKEIRMMEIERKKLEKVQIEVTEREENFKSKETQTNDFGMGKCEGDSKEEVEESNEGGDSESNEEGDFESDGDLESDGELDSDGESSEEQSQSEEELAEDIGRDDAFKSSKSSDGVTNENPFLNLGLQLPFANHERNLVHSKENDNNFEGSQLREREPQEKEEKLEVLNKSNEREKISNPDEEILEDISEPDVSASRAKSKTVSWYTAEQSDYSASKGSESIEVSWRSYHP